MSHNIPVDRREENLQLQHQLHVHPVHGQSSQFMGFQHLANHISKIMNRTFYLLISTDRLLYMSEGVLGHRFKFKSRRLHVSRHTVFQQYDNVSHDDK